MQRDDKIDIIKGIAICCVVLGHCGAPFTHFIYLFHMAVFFIASGLVYKSNYSDSIFGLVTLFRKRIRSLWIPFMFFSAIFLLCWNLLVRFHLYDADFLTYAQILKRLFFKIFMVVGGAVPLCGALWFLFSLFYITMVYGFIDFFVKKFNFTHKSFFHILIAISFFVCNCLLIKSEHKSTTLNQILGPYIAYAFGVALSNWSLNSIKKQLFLPILVVSLLTLLVCNYFGSVELGKGVFTSPQFFIVTSLSGWFFLYSSAYFIEKNSVVKKHLHTLEEILCA